MPPLVGTRRAGQGGWGGPGTVLLGSRLTALVSALLGFVLLGAAAASAVAAGQDAKRNDVDQALSFNAASQAAALKEYFERAESIDLLLANDSVYQKFNPGLGRLSPARSREAAAETGRSMAYLEKLYPDRISEACFIDAAGTELGRVVRGRVAPASEMSMAEKGNPFFAPTMRTPEGSVYQAGPYVSQDTHEWVIANSTPLVAGEAKPWGMVHFEVALDTFRPHPDRQRGFSAFIVDNRTGHVVLDSSQPLVGTHRLGRAGSAELVDLVQRPGTTATGPVDGHRMSVARVPVQQYNANSWSVVSSAPLETGGVSMSITPASLAMAVAGMLLLTFGGLSQRTIQRRLSEARYRALIDQSSDLVLVVDRAGQASFASPAAERLLVSPDYLSVKDPLAPTETGPIDFITAVDPLDQSRFSAALLMASPGRMATGEFRINARDFTSTFEVSVQDLTADPSVGGLVLTGRDVTDRVAMQHEIEHRALHDTLTGLPNRALLADRFEQALLRAELAGTSVGMLMLDLDRFKEINDTFGHHYGDELLRQIGPRLSAELREVDTIARLGGDEFAILLQDMPEVGRALKVAKTLLAALARPFHVEGVDLDVEASIGVVISGDHGQDAITLMQHADIAMYVAKTQHLGVFAYDPTVDGHSAGKLAMVGDLRRALDSDQLILHYQPKINVR
ncbi:MAG: hypothetical protein QOE58_1380, partial [Actinomycetota bacterium]|nr:hypothetical protein [Actinomycetota bacterium]